MKSIQYTALVFLTFILASCSSGPEPLNYGKEACSYCKMGIIDRRFGAEIVTKKGKVYKFDAAECMVHYVQKGNIDPQNIAHYYVVNTVQPGSLTDAEKAKFLISENLPSPMGANISAAASDGEINTLKNEFNGTTLNWDGLRNRF